MNRKFICSKVDLERFSKNLWKLYHGHTMKIEQTRGSQKFPSMADFVKKQMSDYVDLNECTYGFKPDKITKQWIAKVNKTPTADNLHYAIHQVIVQSIIDHNNKKYKVPREILTIYKKVTEDCVE